MVRATDLSTPSVARPPSASSTDIARGASGDAVRQLQLRLTDAGFKPGGVDGKFGAQTARALRAFQAASELPTTGTLNAATASALAAAPSAARVGRNTDSFQPAPTPIAARSTSRSTSASSTGTINSKAVAVTSQLAVRPDLQPKGGVTHCNEFARSYAASMLGNTAQVRSLFAGNAHQQYQHLASAARAGNQGVQEISAAEAGQLGADGRCVVVTTSTLSKGGHGHIAAVVGTDAGGKLRTGQAGTTNYSDGPLSSRFTGSAQGSAHYYVIG